MPKNHYTLFVLIMYKSSWQWSNEKLFGFPCTCSQPSTQTIDKTQILMTMGMAQPLEPRNQLLDLLKNKQKSFLNARCFKFLHFPFHVYDFKISRESGCKKILDRSIIPVK